MRRKKVAMPERGSALPTKKPVAKAKGTNQKNVATPAKKTKVTKSKRKVPTSVDLAEMRKLMLEREEEKARGEIVLSDTWYEFSVFMNKFHICRNTLKKWTDRRWLAYSGIGKLVYINKADLEAMMLHFRHPAQLP
ncbi:MAG: hypothetical protein Q8891_10870 [Bacteroidota bacterium]|nr:hypothetical protein [Bacteroidota bacterium]